MKRIVIFLVVFLGAVPSYGEAPPSFLGGLTKPPVTHEEVATKVRATIDALSAVEIRAKDAELVANIQKVLIWVETKVKQDLKAQASDLANARDVCEAKLKEPAK